MAESGAKFPFTQNSHCFLPGYMTCFDFDIGTCEDDAPSDLEAKRSWYNQGKAYWENQPATTDGMVLGPGANAISEDQMKSIVEADMQGTRGFLEAHNVTGRRALDCGCGIGRVSRGVLAKLFAIVDMAEPSEAFLGLVERTGGAPAGGKLIEEALQDLHPKGPYKLILVNWCCAHVTDDDLIAFIQRASQELTKNGRILVKENVARNNFRARRASASVTRTMSHYHDIFRLAGVEVEAEQKQAGMPDDWLDIMMFMLRRKAE